MPDRKISKKRKSLVRFFKIHDFLTNSPLNILPQHSVFFVCGFKVYQKINTFDIVSPVNK